MKLNYKHTLITCCAAYIVQGIINNLLPLFFIIFQTDYGISFEMLGRLILINFGTQIIVDIIAAKYSARLGYRLSLIIGLGFATLGLVLIGVLPHVLPLYPALVISMVTCAIGGGVIEVLVSPTVDSLPGEAKASVMSLLHSFYCWGQMAVVLITTLLLTVTGYSYWYIIPIIWAAVPLLTLLAFTIVPIPDMLEESKTLKFGQLMNIKLFPAALLMMVCAGASEITMSQWSSLFAEVGLSVPKVVGDILGPCLFAVMMGIVRVLFGIWGEKMRLHRVLVYSSLLCIVCYAMTSLSMNPFISFIGCALCGVSVTLMWPATLSLTAAKIPQGGTFMFGILALAGDVGCSIGPWMAGIISETARGSQHIILKAAELSLSADQAALKTGILFGILFPIVLFFGVKSFMKSDRQTLAKNPVKP